MSHRTLLILRRPVCRHTVGHAKSWATTQRAAFSTTRCAASEAATTASQATEQLIEAFRDRSDIRRQVLDANQLQKLSLTLGRRELFGVDVSEAPPAPGTPVPPGWHLVYFTPNGLESDLGADGTDRTYNSPAPFTRRMWAGGRMRWPEAEAGGERALLRVGDEVEERTRFLDAKAKKNAAGREMILVEIEKEFWGPRGLCLTDRRFVLPRNLRRCFGRLTGLFTDRGFSSRRSSRRLRGLGR